MGKPLFFKASIVALLLFIFLVIKAPANLVGVLVSSVFPQLKMSQYHGSVWDGSASKATLNLNGIALFLGKVSWHIEPKSLLLLNPAIDVKTQAASHNFSAEVNLSPLGEVSITDFSGDFPSTLLEPWIPLLISGDVEFMVDRLSFIDESIVELEGNIDLNQAKWIAGDHEMLLGSYQANISLQNSSDIAIDIIDKSAALGIDGKFNAAIQGVDAAYQFKATLKPKANLAPEIVRTLRFFGKRNEQGEILINQSGRW